MILTSFIISTVLSLILYFLTYNLVNNIDMALWLKYNVFNQRPWNCHLCFFNLLSSFSAILGIILYVSGMISIYFGIIQAIYTLIIDLGIYLNLIKNYKK